MLKFRFVKHRHRDKKNFGKIEQLKFSVWQFCLMDLSFCNLFITDIDYSPVPLLQRYPHVQHTHMLAVNVPHCPCHSCIQHTWCDTRRFHPPRTNMCVLLSLTIILFSPSPYHTGNTFVVVVVVVVAVVVAAQGT